MKKMFLSGAIFNWSMAIVFWFFPVESAELLGIAPVPTSPVYSHLFGTLVFMFGVAYYWVSIDPKSHQDLIKLGAIAKMVLVATGVLDVMLGAVTWPVLIPLSVDFIYSILFFMALKTLADTRHVH